MKIEDFVKNYNIDENEFEKFINSDSFGKYEKYLKTSIITDDITDISDDVDFNQLMKDFETFKSDRDLSKLKPKDGSFSGPRAQKISERSYTFHYVASFFFPFMGFIMSAIFLTKDDDNEITIGKNCFGASIASLVILALIIGFVLMIINN